MRLSDAIRLGSMLRPQCFGEAFIDGKSCAMGAAMEAVGVKYHTIYFGVWSDVVDRWPWLDDAYQPRCPLCQLMFGAVSLAISHLNDQHRWTREAIADWVATIEPAESPVLIPDPVPVTSSALGGAG